MSQLCSCAEAHGVTFGLEVCRGGKSGEGGERGAPGNDDGAWSLQQGASGAFGYARIAHQVKGLEKSPRVFPARAFCSLPSRAWGFK